MPGGDFFQHDLRFAIRQLRRNPGFTLAAISVLALGLCASIAIFAFADAALLKPLPYRDPARLAGVYERIPLCERCNLSYFDYLDWKRMNQTLQSLAIYSFADFRVRTPGGVERAEGARVSAGFFRTLGVTPVLGRDFTEGEDQPSAANAVLLSYPCWQTRFGGKRDVVGKTIDSDNVPYIVVGVLPPDFHFAPLGRVEFWAAIHANRPCEQRRGCHNLWGVGRLKDNVSLETASADFARIAAQLASQYPDTNRGQTSNIVPLTDVIAGRVRPVLVMLLSGAALLLLIAAINVANLVLVRAEARKREIAVRGSLGASPARLAAQFGAEGLLLSLGGAALGLIPAQWLIVLLTRLIPRDMLDGMPYLAGLGLHAREWSFAAAVALIAAALFGITPMLRLPLSDPRPALGESSRGHSGSAWRRLGSHLVIVELATAVVLLAGAALLGESLYRVLQVDLGMRPDHIATLRVAVPASSYSREDQFLSLNHEMLRRVSALPGVESAAATSMLPVGGGNTSWIRFGDRPFHGEHNEVGEREVTPEYFRTLGARLAAGRFFTEADDASKPRVAIVDRTFVKKYYPSQDPIGRQIFFQSPTSKPMTIVGIVDDIKEGAIDSTTWPTMYLPFDQNAGGYFTLVVRTSQEPHAVLPALVAAVHGYDPGLMTADPRTMADRIGNSPAAYLRRCSAWLAAGFAALALILGVVGLYGVIAYSVSQRTREIGVRIALGAQPRAVYKLILLEAGRLAAAGVFLGLLGSLGAAALLRSLLFGIKGIDIATFAAVAGVLAISALAASFLPAHRAASVDPVEALRSE